MAKILIADDHQIFLDGMNMLFEGNNAHTVVGLAKNGDEVLEMVPQMEPDLVLLDINMPGKNGVDTARELRQKNPLLKIIMLSMYQKAYFTEPLMEMGVQGYILKNTNRKELEEAISIVLEGGKYYTKEVVENLEQRKQELEDQEHALTDREVQIINCLAQGMSTMEISQKLFISTYTVDTHRKNILRKSGQGNVVQLIKWAEDLEYIRTL